MDMTEKMELKGVKYEKKGMIAYVAWNTGKHNMYTNDTIVELQRVWSDFERDKELRVAIFYGDGKSFCAGHDLWKGEAITSEPATIHKREVKISIPVLPDLLIVIADTCFLNSAHCFNSPQGNFSCCVYSGDFIQQVTAELTTPSF